MVSYSASRFVLEILLSFLFYVNVANPQCFSVINSQHTQTTIPNFCFIAQPYLVYNGKHIGMIDNVHWLPHPHLVWGSVSLPFSRPLHSITDWFNKCYRIKCNTQKRALLDRFYVNRTITNCCNAIDIKFSYFRFFLSFFLFSHLSAAFTSVTSIIHTTTKNENESTAKRLRFIAI